MASIADDPGGRRRILFVAPDGGRKTIRLGKIDRRSEESICRHVEALLGAKIGGQPIPRDTATWLAGIGAKLRDWLAAAGLVEGAGKPEAPKLGEWCRDYMRRQTHVKPASRLATEQAVRNLLDHFGEKRPIDGITAGGADDFRKWLLSDGRSHRQGHKPRRLSGATVAKRLQRCTAGLPHYEGRDSLKNL
jgi:hypothetical protein